MDVTSVSGRGLYRFGPFRLDAASRVLLRDDHIVPLPPKVLETLLLLIENHGRVLSKDELMRALWPDTYVDQNSLMHNVSVLRKVLGDSPDGKPYIETAPRRGYRFIGDVQVLRANAMERGRTPSLRAVSITAGLGVAAILLAVMFIKSRAQPALRITPLTSYPGTEDYAAFSPDGRQVAFVWNGERQDQFDIYVKAIGMDPPRRVTLDAQSECHLAWSPDGAQIAYTQCGSADPNAPAGTVGLYVVPYSGGPRRNIAYIFDGGNPDERPFAWTPDGKALIIGKAIGGTAGTGLFLVPAGSDAQRRQVTFPQTGSWDSAPAISPDSQTLAFVRSRSHGLSDIYLVGLDKHLNARGQPKRLTFDNDFVTNLVWTNNGSELLYAAGNEGTRGVWRIHARMGSNRRQAPELAQAGVHFALSRDGKLAYSRRSWDFDIWRAELDGKRAASELIASTFSDDEPKYSPDGRSIAFQSNRTGAMEIWRSYADGTAATQVTALHAEAGSPAWSPDGRDIAFDCSEKGNIEIYVADASDGRLRRITSDPGVHTTPSWSRDGKWIYFASKQTGRLEVWKVSSIGGEAAQVTRSGGFLASESADRKYVYYAKSSDFPTPLWRKSLNSGTEEPVIDAIANWFDFAVFSDGIYFIPAHSPNKEFDSFELDYYDFLNRSMHRVSEINKWAGIGFSVSPDRRSVLFAPSETHGGDLMLVENFQ